uniref:Uncharacterized protein n=1 Tax=Romanomermis culicivorax TaxID=13658 RepID=A0A915IWX6_ROMCU
MKHKFNKNPTGPINVCNETSTTNRVKKARLKKEEGSNDRWSDALVGLFSVVSYGMSNQNFGHKARTSPAGDAHRPHPNNMRNGRGLPAIGHQYE